MLSSDERRRALQAILAGHVAEHWRVVEQFDEMAVVAFGQPPREVRRTLRVDETGSVFYRDPGGGDVWRPLSGQAAQTAAEAATTASAGLASRAKPSSQLTSGQRLLVGGVAAVGAGLFLIGAVSAVTDAPRRERLREAREADARDQSGSSAPTQAPGPSLSGYLSLREGMTYAQAVSALGSSGQEISRSNLAGFTTVMYQWTVDDGSGANMNAMFQNDRLVTKAQFGLK
jgi:hypothetical protein